MNKNKRFPYIRSIRRKIIFFLFIATHRSVSKEQTFNDLRLFSSLFAYADWKFIAIK